MKNVVYINLKYRTDRRIYTEKQFLNIGINAHRMEAIESPDGAIGCTLSHIRCIEYAKKHNLSSICICEDDILFTNPTLFITKLETFLQSDIEWDVLLVGANIAPPFEKTNDFCMKVYNAQTTTGYIVKQHYYDTLLKNFKDGLTSLLKNTDKKREYAIDMYWKILQKQDKWFILIPLSVVQVANYSDIEHRIVNYSNYMLDDKSNINAS